MQITAPAGSPTAPLDSVDLFDPHAYVHSCHHPIWDRMRHEAPVWRQTTPDGTPFWSFTTYRDCNQILRDPRTFSSQDGTILASVGIGDAAGGQTVTLMDPPEHTAVRGPAMRLLGKGSVARRVAQVQARVEALVAPLCEGGDHDIVPVARRLPMTMFGDLMGVPRELWDDIGFWASASIAPDDAEFRSHGSVGQVMRRAHHELFRLFGEALKVNRRDPGDNLLTALGKVQLCGRPLDDWQIMLNCYSYVLGAHSTTPHVWGHTLLVLTENDELWRKVQADPDLVPALIEEGSRWTSPTHHLVRRVAQDVVVHDEELAEGDWICAWVASANRDETVFEDPYEFRIDRTSNPHLSFGAGPHYCIGTHLSRAALGMVFRELVTRLDRIEPAGAPAHLASNWINGLTALPVTTHPGRTPC